MQELLLSAFLVKRDLHLNTWKQYIKKVCGIAGIVHRSHKLTEDLSAMVNRMTDAIHHRGPDDSGLFAENGVGLGHRRLSIIDLTPTGHQPIFSQSGRYVVVFNGEIYNHLDIRKELIAMGYTFRGTSDSETIANGFETWGDKLFVKLNGIFALAIYDREFRTLVLARDRFGVKPLYYSAIGADLYFGSEIKTILSAGIKPRVNYKGLVEFLYFGNALGKETLFENIFKLLPGGQIKTAVDSANIELSHFWNPESLKPLDNDITEVEAVEETSRLLELAVKRQLLSDVPVGVFLSGGIDSSAITAFASKHAESPINSFSAGFDFSPNHNELPLAKKIAAKYGTHHHELMVKGENLPDIIQKLVIQHDEPFSDAANIPLYLLTEQVKGANKVILQGDGGDELFGGYNRYFILKNTRLLKLFSPFISGLNKLSITNNKLSRIKRINYALNSRVYSDKFAKLLTLETEDESPVNVLNKQLHSKINGFSPFERYEELSDRFSFLEDDVQKMLWLDTQIILPDQFLEKVDKSTMANSIEVRVPFLDNDLAGFAMRLPSSLKLKNGEKKYLLKKALSGVVDHEILYGPKKGFGVPYQNWLRGPLNHFFLDTVYSDDIRALEIIDYDHLEHMLKNTPDPYQTRGFMLWKLLNLCLWVKTYKVSF